MKKYNQNLCLAVVLTILGFTTQSHECHAQDTTAQQSTFDFADTKPLSVLDKRESFVWTMPESELPKNSDYKNWKLLKNTGWTSIGIGIPLMFGSFVSWVAASSCDGCNAERMRQQGETFMIVGAALTFGSIPQLILSKKFKRRWKKASLDFTRQQLDLPMVRSQPAITFKFNL